MEWDCIFPLSRFGWERCAKIWFVLGAIRLFLKMIQCLYIKHKNKGFKMVSSTFYFSDTLRHVGMQQAVIFVLGSSEHIQAAMLIQQAVQKGASVIIMAREYAGTYRQLCQNELRPGVTYIFSRAIHATLARWQARLL